MAMPDNQNKTVIVSKVFERDCHSCLAMSKYDWSVMEEFPEIAYQQIDIDDIISESRKEQPNLTLLRLYQCLERYALNPDYTVSFPTYVFLSKAGKYMGCIVGEHTISDLRGEINQIVNMSS